MPRFLITVCNTQYIGPTDKCATADLECKVPAKTVKYMLNWTPIELKQFPQTFHHCQILAGMATFNNLSNDVQVVFFSSYMQQTLHN